jgi:hypothetical protein
MGLTFVMSVFAWIFFRANNVKEAFEFILGIFSKSLFNMPYIIEEGTGKQILPKTIFLLIFILIIVEWLGRENQHALEKINTKFHKPLRYLLYVLILFSIFWFGGREQEFIYFQF